MDGKDYIERFNKYSGNLSEEENITPQGNDQMAQDNGQMGQNGMGDDMSGQNMDNSTDDFGQNGMDNGQETNMGGTDAEPQKPEGLNPQNMDDGNEGLDNGNETDTFQNQNETEDEDVEEIDVDELVDSQDETNKKIDVLLKRFTKAAEKMVSATSKISDKFDEIDQKVKTLEGEIIKRNPTPVEKMTLRSANSYPFNVSPKNYWEKKEMTSNYSPESDNNGEDDPQYKITKGDIDNMTNYYAYAKEMDKANKLSNILNF